MTKKQNQFVTYHEIITQTEAWKQALQVVSEEKLALQELFNRKFDESIFTGCGSTYYFSASAASYFQELSGRRAIGVPAGELLLYPNNTYRSDAKSILIAISRSGESTETVEAVNQFQEDGRGAVITITNNDQSSFASRGVLNFTIPAGKEKSIAQTRAFTSLYVCSTAIPLLAYKKEALFDKFSEVPDAGVKLIEEYESLARNIGENQLFDRFYFLGGGVRYGLACEANLKMKEMSLTHSEPFHFLEFRHGPKSMVNDSTMMIGFVSTIRKQSEMKVLSEMQSLGARTLAIAQGQADVQLPDNLPNEILSVLYLPIMQLMAYYRSIGKGLNPDHPNNLDKVVELDLLGI
jgi:glucosamine--fructose-6-phosphate aminotransferase (isomerizing)